MKILQFSKSTRGDLDVAEFADPNAGIEEQPQHQTVLNVIGSINDLVEPPEVVLG